MTIQIGLGPALRHGDLGPGRLRPRSGFSWRCRRASRRWLPSAPCSVADPCPVAEGALSAEPGPSGAASWIHDPADPVPTPVPNAFAYLEKAGPRLQAWSERPDVVVFDGDPVPWTSSGGFRSG